MPPMLLPSFDSSVFFFSAEAAEFQQWVSSLIWVHLCRKDKDLMQPLRKRKSKQPKCMSNATPEGDLRDLAKKESKDMRNEEEGAIPRKTQLFVSRGAAEWHEEGAQYNIQRNIRKGEEDKRHALSLLNNQPIRPLLLICRYTCLSNLFKRAVDYKLSNSKYNQ